MQSGANRSSSAQKFNQEYLTADYWQNHPKRGFRPCPATRRRHSREGAGLSGGCEREKGTKLVLADDRQGDLSKTGRVKSFPQGCAEKHLDMEDSG